MTRAEEDLLLEQQVNRRLVVVYARSLMAAFLLEKRYLGRTQHRVGPATADALQTLRDYLARERRQRNARPEDCDRHGCDEKCGECAGRV